jgi:HEAT repeat protein
MNLEIARKNLDSTNTDSVMSALHAFGAAGQLTHLQILLPYVKNANADIRHAAIEACCTLIRHNLVAHFHDLAPAVRKKLGTVMESLDPEIIDGISNDLYCDDENRRLRSVQILGLLKKNPKIREVLAKLVKDKNEKIRATAVNLLGKVVGPHDQDIIMTLMHDQDKRVRANTVEALESLGNKRLVPVLLRFRKDPNNRIRGNVLKALYNLDYKEIEPDLLEMMSNPNEFMKASALWVVSQTKITSVEIENTCAQFLLSNNDMVKTNARKALKTLDTPRSHGFLKYLDFNEPEGLEPLEVRKPQDDTGQSKK